MELSEALNVFDLSIDSLSNQTVETLDTLYRKQALHCHPDKTGGSNEKFIALQEAYELLKMKIVFDSTHPEIDVNDGDDYSRSGNEKVFSHMMHFYQKHKDTFTDVMKSMHHTFNDYCIGKITSMTDDDLVRWYSFIKGTKMLRFLHTDTRARIDERIQAHQKNTETKCNINTITVLTTLSDIMNNTILKREYKNSTIFVPLWHSEVYYDVSIPNTDTDSDVNNNNIIELCVQIEYCSSSQWYIDHNSNLFIFKTVPFDKDILFQENLQISVDNVEFNIPCKDLIMTHKQTVRLRKKGACCIVENDLYNVGKRGDVFILLIFN